MATASQQQIDAFNMLRQRPGVFSDEQLKVIDILEKRGELEQNIIPIMQKVKARQAGSPTPETPASPSPGAPEAAPEGPATPQESADGNVGSGGFFGTASEDVMRDMQQIGDDPQQFMMMLAKTNIRPMAQGLTGAGGAIIGSGAGPVGTVAGGALGFAIGDDIADILENFLGLREPQPIKFELQEAGKNIMEGAKWEIAGGSVAAGAGMTATAIGKSRAGQAIAETLGKIKSKMPPLKASSARKMVGEVLAADIKGRPPIIAENVEQAQILEDMIPGLKFEYGKLTKDSTFMALEKDVAKEMPEYAAQRNLRQDQNLTAIENFLEQQKGIINDDVAKQIFGAEQELVERGTITARRRLAEAEAGLRAPEEAVTEAGQTIKGEMREGYHSAKEESSALFKGIGHEAAPAESIVTKIEELAVPFERGEDVVSNFPADLKKVYVDFLRATGRDVPKSNLPGLGKLPKDLTPTKAMSYSDINSYRKRLKSALDNLKGMPPHRRNKQMEKRLAEVITSMEDILNAGVKDEKYTAMAIRKARDLHKKNVYEPFETGRTSEVLDDKVSDAKVAAEFFQKGPEGTVAAKQFKKALGNNKKANDALRLAIKQNFLDEAVNPVTKEIKPDAFVKWKSKYRYALKEFDMLDEFADVAKASENLQAALEIEKTFKGSIAADALQADPGDMVKQVISGKNPGYKMAELMRKLGNNQDAIQGIQNSLVTELQRIGMREGSVDKIGNWMYKNRNVLKAAFKDSPQKLKAMEMYHQSLERVFPGKAEITGSAKEFQSILEMLSRPARMSRGVTATMIHTAGRVIKTWSRAETKQLIMKASMDPEFAFGLIYEMKHYKPQNFERFLKRSFIGISETTANREE